MQRVKKSVMYQSLYFILHFNRKKLNKYAINLANPFQDNIITCSLEIRDVYISSQNNGLVLEFSLKFDSIYIHKHFFFQNNENAHKNSFDTSVIQ